MTTRTIATYCLHQWQTTDVPGMFACLDCTASATYNSREGIYWIED